MAKPAICIRWQKCGPTSQEGYPPMQFAIEIITVTCGYIFHNCNCKIHLLITHCSLLLASKLKVFASSMSGNKTKQNEGLNIKKAGQLARISLLKLQFAYSGMRELVTDKIVFPISNILNFPII